MSGAAERRAYVGLGSNLDRPVAQIERAFEELAALPDTRLVARSRLYGSPPMGPAAQPDFVNAVAALETRLAPRALLEALHGVERAHRRVRDGSRWGPRTLDLDLLLYADRRIDEPGLHVPHPGVADRPFVLLPLAEVAPATLPIPGLGRLADLLAACDRRAMRVLETAA